MWTTNLGGGEVGTGCPLASLRGLVDSFLASMPATVSADGRALIEPIVRLLPAIGCEEVQITFLGAFKTGKSTLINALIGAEVLPTRTNRATGVITRVRTGPDRSASVMRRAPDGAVFSEAIPWDQLARYVLLDVSDGMAQAIAGVEEVSIFYPLPAHWASYVLVDTPGLLDTGDLTARTLAELERTDLAVLVLAADKLLGVEEVAVARQTHEMLGGNVVFVINRMDLVEADQRPEVLKRAESVLASLGNPLVGQPCIFSTRARRALEARKGLQHCVLSLKDIVRFEQWIHGVFSGAVGNQIVHLSRLSVLTRQLAMVGSHLEARFKVAQATLDALRTRDQMARRERLARLARDAAHDQSRVAAVEGQLPAMGDRFIEQCVELFLSMKREWSNRIKAANMERTEAIRKANNKRDDGIAAANQQYDQVAKPADEKRAKIIEAADKQRNAVVVAANEKRDGIVRKADEDRAKTIAILKAQDKTLGDFIAVNEDWARAVAAGNKQRDDLIRAAEEPRAKIVAKANKERDEIVRPAEENRARIVAEANRQREAAVTFAKTRWDDVVAAVRRQQANAIDDSINAVLTRYQQAVCERTQSAVQETRLILPLLDLREARKRLQAIRAATSSDAERESVKNLFRELGGNAFDSVARWLMDSFGDDAEGWLGQNPFEDAKQQKMLETIRQTARSLSPVLRGEANTYLALVKSSLDDYYMARKDDHVAAPDSFEAEARTSHLRRLVDWCETCQHAVERARKELLK